MSAHARLSTPKVSLENVAQPLQQHCTQYSESRPNIPNANRRLAARWGRWPRGALNALSPWRPTSPRASSGVSLFPTVIGRVGRYLAAEAKVPVGSALGYLIAPPLEAMVGVDAALKAAEVTLVRFFGPSTTTNVTVQNGYTRTPPTATLTAMLGEGQVTALRDVIAPLGRNGLRDLRNEVHRYLALSFSSPTEQGLVGARKYRHGAFAKGVSRTRMTTLAPRHRGSRWLRASTSAS